jgi:hypothetical protein
MTPYRSLLAGLSATALAACAHQAPPPATAATADAASPPPERLAPIDADSARLRQVRDLYEQHFNVTREGELNVAACRLLCDPLESMRRDVVLACTIPSPEDKAGPLDWMQRSAAAVCNTRPVSAECDRTRLLLTEGEASVASTGCGCW